MEVCLSPDSKSLVGFLEVEIENLRDGPRNLEAIEPGGMAALEACNALLVSLTEEFSRSGAFKRQRDAVAAWKEKHGVGDEVIQLLLSGALLPGPDDETVQAKSQATEAWAVLVRAMLLMRVVRDYWYGASDLLRNRTTYAAGSLRTQMETIGQQILIHDDPAIALEFFPARSTPDGRALHNKYHRIIMEKVRPFGVERYKRRAEELQMHSRMAGISMGMAFGRTEPSKPGKVVLGSLSAQDTDDPALYRLCVVNFLEFFGRLLINAELILPDTQLSIDFTKKAAQFRTDVSASWKRLEPEAEKRGWKR